jgi:hypothetical protein
MAEGGAVIMLFRTAATNFGRKFFCQRGITGIINPWRPMAVRISGCIAVVIVATFAAAAGVSIEGNGAEGTDGISIVHACSEFFSNHYQIIFLVDAAKKRGMTASAQEITGLIREYGMLCPGRDMDEQMARDEILSQDYLESMCAHSLSNGELADAYAGLFPTVNDAGRIRMDDIKRLLKTKVLLSLGSAQELIGQVRDEQDSKMIRDINRTFTYWPKDSLRIEGNSNDCVATDPDDGRCLISVRRFNDAIGFYPTLKESAVEAGRFSALKLMLEDIYFAKQAKVNWFANKDSARILMDQWKLRRIWSESVRGFGRMENDERLLRRAYSKYYDYRFRKYADLSVSVLGSTDSNQIDSLLNLALSEKAVKDTATGVGPCSQQSLLPWVHCKADSLNPAVAGVAYGFQIGDISKPILTPFGRFIIRIDSAVVHPAVSFEDARNKLIVLATKEKWQNVDSLLLDQAYRLYKAKAARYRTPDTLALRLWLWPGVNPGLSRTVRQPAGGSLRKTVKQFSSKSGVDTAAIIDTIARPSVAVVSTQLPAAVAAIVNAGYTDASVKNAVLGPYSTKFGTFAFKVNSVKRGGISIPFAAVKWHLYDSLMAISCDSVRYTEAEDSLFAEIALANCYKDFLYEQIQRDAANMIGAMGQEMTSDSTSAQPFDGGLALQQKNIRRATEWMKTLSIGPVFFKRGTFAW